MPYNLQFSQACRFFTWKVFIWVFSGLVLRWLAAYFGVRPFIGSMATFYLLILFTYYFVLSLKNKYTIPYQGCCLVEGHSSVCPICCVCQRLLRLPTRSTKKRLFDSMFWISSVSLMACVISKNFLVRILWFTVSQAAERSTKAAPVIRHFLYPSSMN